MICTPSQDNPLLPYYLALWRIAGIGPAAFFKISEHFAHLPDVFKASPADLVPLKLAPETIAALRQPDWASVERDLAWAAQSPDHHILTWLDSAYPPLLQEISAAPPLIICTRKQSPSCHASIGHCW